MRLTEFLLARIAKDEATLPTRANLDSATQRRMRVECEARQRLVALHEHDEDGHGNRSCGQCDFGGYHSGWCETLRLLALPYANHPDYDEEWRP